MFGDIQFSLDSIFSCRLGYKETSVTISWSKHAFCCSLKSWIKGFDTQPPGSRSIVEMKASGKQCESQRATARSCTIWWRLATRPLIRPSKPIVSALFRLQREYWSVWKTAQSNTAKGIWEAGVHLCVVQTLSGILQKRVHVNKQTVGKVPELGCSTRYCLW